MTRRGRTRSVKPRYPSGQVKPEKVKTTPQNEARRTYLAGEGDPVLTTFPLGVLWANEAISMHKYRAGCRYAWLYEIVLGKVSIAAANYDGVTRGPTGEISDEEFDRINEKMETWEDELSRASHRLIDVRAKVVTDSLVVYGIPANWMRPKFPTMDDIHEAKLLKAGLNVLMGALSDVG